MLFYDRGFSPPWLSLLSLPIPQGSSHCSLLCCSSGLRRHVNDLGPHMRLRGPIHHSRSWASYKVSLASTTAFCTSAHGSSGSPWAYSCKADHSASLGTACKAAAKRLRVNCRGEPPIALCQHRRLRQRYAPRPFALPVISTQICPSGVRTMRMSSRFPRTARQAIQVRKGVCFILSPDPTESLPSHPAVVQACVGDERCKHPVSRHR